MLKSSRVFSIFDSSRERFCPKEVFFFLSAIWKKKRKKDVPVVVGQLPDMHLALAPGAKLTKSIQVNASFMKNVKSSGPRIEPRGHPF